MTSLVLPQQVGTWGGGYLSHGWGCWTAAELPLTAKFLQVPHSGFPLNLYTRHMGLYMVTLNFYISLHCFVNTFLIPMLKYVHGLKWNKSTCIFFIWLFVCKSLNEAMTSGNFKTESSRLDRICVFGVVGSWKLEAILWKLEVGSYTVEVGRYERGPYELGFGWRRQGCGEEQAPSYCVNCMAVRHVFYYGAAGSDFLCIVWVKQLFNPFKFKLIITGALRACVCTRCWWVQITGPFYDPSPSLVTWQTDKLDIYFCMEFPCFWNARTSRLSAHLLVHKIVSMLWLEGDGRVGGNIQICPPPT